MKIGIDVRSVGANRTGDEVYVLNLVRGLAKIDKDNQYFLLSDKTQFELENLRKLIFVDENQGKNFSLVSILPAHKAFWTFFALPNYLRKNPLDVLHVQYIVPFLFPLKTRIVTTIHDISFNFFPAHMRKTDWLFLKTLIPPSLKRAKKIIGVSEFTAQAVREYYALSQKKVRAVNNGGAAEEFFQLASAEKKEQVKKKYKLENKFILSVGTLQPRKNIPFLMRAFAEFKKEYAGNQMVDELVLAIGGNRKSVNFDQEIEKAEKEIGKNFPELKEKIKFLGFIDQQDLPALFQSAEVFCFPSLYEGFGLPLLEAMASGTPVLCSDSSCFPAIAGEAASFFQQNDSREFTKKLFSLIINQEKKMELIEKGKKRAQEFSWEQCAKETLKVYKTL